jgi:hypothetical protein
MAEKKGVGHAYNVDFLNVVFAASSLFLFLSTIWMVWDDYSREWKNVQRRFVALELQVTQASLEKAQNSVDANKQSQLQSALAAAQKNVETNRQKVDELERQVRAVDARLYRETQEYTFAKATRRPTTRIATTSSRRGRRARRARAAKARTSPSRESG